ncbi:hypothetical protein AVEN_258028-1 [Araneus ventricosus]|uniref:Uncharacterized protein n=1 Tax=Araneus ventricosus TaxID=182803 RepID=A0A4Y2QJM2_ARAVE|nr:hypothetical protein AVEN_258028-1 [Araneus ventricosus]
MDLGFIDSPHLLTYVNYSPPSTKLKYRDELNLRYTLNHSYGTPVSANMASVKDSNFWSFIFVTDQSQNKVEKETGSDESSLNNVLIWNTKTMSPLSHGDLMPCNAEDEFSPFMSSSPNLEASRKVKTSQDLRSSIGELNRFVHNSYLQKPKNNSSENSTILDNDSLNFLNQGFDDGNSENNSSEDSTNFESDSLKVLNEESLKPLLSFHETAEISPQVSDSGNISLYPVSRNPGVLEKCIDVLGGESAVLSETSCTYVSAASNIDTCILHSIENNEVSYQFNAGESNNLSNTLAFFQTTKDEIVERDINIDLPFPLNKPCRKQFLESNLTILETPERRCSILNGKSEDTFEIPAQNLSAGDGHDSEFGIKHNMVRLENMTRMLQDMADSFEFENEWGNTILEEDFTLFLNNELRQRPESIIKNEVAETFHIDVCDSTLGTKVIGFHPENTTNLMPEDVCGTKYQSCLRDSWDIDCGVSASDKIITSTNIRENLNFECDSGLYSKGSPFHPVNSTTMISENVCGVKCRSEFRDSLQIDCGISYNAITAPCVIENLEVEDFSPSLYTTDQQITTCNYIGQSGGQMTPIQDIKIPERKILPQIVVESFMKEESMLRNDFSSHAFTETADRTLCTVENFITEQTSLQIVSYRSKTLQASTASMLEFSPDLDFIGKRKDFDYLELSARNVDLMLESNNENYSLSERDAKSDITASKKCLTFPSISNHHAKENEFAVCKKESNYKDTTFQSKINENQEGSSEVDLDDFVSASEYYSSSSEVFYDLEEFYDMSDCGSSEKENCCTDIFQNCEVATPFPDFKNKSILQDRSTNRGKSQTSSATKNNSTSDLFNSNEPVIIKYLNEHTQEIEEMLIYPIEYHEKLIGEIGAKSLSRKEALEKLIERSKFYVGKPVGIILDVKDIRKKHKPMPEEGASSAELLKERNSERVNILAIKKSLTDFQDANAFSGFASGGNIHCEKQIVRSRKEDHRSEDSRAFTVSCPRKLQQNETGTTKEIQTESDDAIIPCHSNICKHPTVSHTNSAVYLRENTNVYSNDQTIVVSSVSKYRSKKGYCSPSPIQKLDAVSSKPNSNCQENNHKRWLHERKQPLKSVLNSRSIANSSKPSTFIIHSTKQREVRILRKAQTDNFTTCPMKPTLSEVKGNLTHHSAGYSSLRAIQKYDSSSNKHLNNSHEKWLQKRELKGNLTHHSAGLPCSLAIQKYDSFSNKHLNNSQEKWFQKINLPPRKRVNIDEIISSDFKTYFNSFAKRGGRLKSGSVISKSNSNYWLKKAGVVYDEKSLKIAEESFAEVARKKVVLNICDYMQFLIILSRREKICLADLVQRLKTADISGPTDAKKRIRSILKEI